LRLQLGPLVAGQRIGRLVILEVLPSRRKDVGQGPSRCRCDCGREVLLKSNLVRNGARSCGCWHKERITPAHPLRHGTRHSWHAMWRRCTKATERSYPRYGGRGIAVCDRWRDLEAFIADMGLRPAGLTLERINNDGPYSPENCRWATYSEQNRNKSVNREYEYGGKRQCLSAWAEEYGLEQATLYYRLVRLKWPLSEALTTPVGMKRCAPVPA
jgi:hypothetical protein